MKGKRELMVRLLMVVAPLVMLAAITIAWFVNNRTVGASEMSFASEDATSAMIYEGVLLPDSYQYTPAKDQIPETVTNTIEGWTGPTNAEEFELTIKNMVPGQANYYLIKSGNLCNVSLTNITWQDDAGNLLTDGSQPAGYDGLYLSQCLGFYLRPIPKDEDPKYILKQRPVTISLNRDNAGQLLEASLSSVAEPPLPITVQRLGSEGDAPWNSYILVIYCDPIYKQGTASNPVYLDHLAGSVTFSLSISKAVTES